MKANKSLSSGDPEIFWGEMSPTEHFVQIYDLESAFLDTLAGFVVGGLRTGDATIVIATPAHLFGLENRMRALCVDVDEVRTSCQYLPLDARETLSRFIVERSDGTKWPDEAVFEELVIDLIERARGSGGRRVRAFGEMVAILWQEGCTAATVRLEYLWHRFCHEQAFCLFCAYPKIGFTDDADAGIKEICAAHSRTLAEHTPRGMMAARSSS